MAPPGSRRLGLEGWLGPGGGGRAEDLGEGKEFLSRTARPPGSLPAPGRAGPQTAGLGRLCPAGGSRSARIGTHATAAPLRTGGHLGKVLGVGVRYARPRVSRASWVCGSAGGGAPSHPHDLMY